MMGRSRNRLTNKITRMLLVVAALFGVIYPLQPAVLFADNGDYSITYINNGTSTVKTYAAGSTITLDSLPGGATAWTDNNDPSVPNHKMAYVSYDRQVVINRDMTLTADYGSYANGAPGPRLIQFHLELKYYEDSIGAMLEFQQQYANTNAPAGYYIHLPDENFFDPIQFTTSPPVDVQNPDLKIYKWIYDASYTGGGPITDDTLLHDPSSLIYVDPNNYNQIYNVMVDPSFDITDPGPGITPVLLPSLLPKEAVTFKVSQKDLPIGGGFIADSQNYIYTVGNDTSENTYMQRPAHSASWEYAFTSPPPGPGVPYDLLPTPQAVAGYTYYWIKDADAPLLTDVVAGTAPNITASHGYILQYVPNTPLLPVVVTADRQTHTWDGQPHSASGYTSTGLDDGDQLVFSSRSLLATTSVTQTDVGTYPLVMSPRDFIVKDSGNNTVAGKYSISVIGGGLTILPVPLSPEPPAGVNPPNTGLTSKNLLWSAIAVVVGLGCLGWVVVQLRHRPS